MQIRPTPASIPPLTLFLYSSVCSEYPLRDVWHPGCRSFPRAQVIKGWMVFFFPCLMRCHRKLRQSSVLLILSPLFHPFFFSTRCPAPILFLFPVRFVLPLSLSLSLSVSFLSCRIALTTSIAPTALRSRHDRYKCNPLRSN